MPAVRDATSFLLEIRRHKIVPVASIGKPHNVTSGARYIIDIPIGPDLYSNRPNGNSAAKLIVPSVVKTVVVSLSSIS